MKIIDADEIVYESIDSSDTAKYEYEHGTGIFAVRKEDIDAMPTIQPEIIRCKDCKYWVPGYITDNDDFIPPKCGEWQQMVGHSSDDYCSLAERREATT